MKRLLLDYSTLWRNPTWNTGIERVARRLGEELISITTTASNKKYEIIPVALDDDGIFVTLDHIPKINDIEMSNVVEELLILPEDIYFVLDANWDRRVLYKLYPPWSAGLTVGVMQYDLIPLRIPWTCVSYMRQAFSDWLRECSEFVDFYSCISGSTEKFLLEEIQKRHPWRTSQESLSTFSFRLGADFPKLKGDNSHIRQNLVSIFGSKTNVFVTVGTLEPRKDHETILNAFEELWRQDKEVVLCIIGKQGWNVTELVSRIKSLQKRGCNLYWFEDLTDLELSYAYKNCLASIVASIEEGFGLPVVEATHHQRLTLASDIAAFREVAPTGTRFFHPGDSLGLQNLISEIAFKQDKQDKLETKISTVTTWNESALEWLDKLDTVAQPNWSIRATQARERALL